MYRRIQATFAHWFMNWNTYTDQYFFSYTEHCRHDGQEDLCAEPVPWGSQEGNADSRAGLRRGPWRWWHVLLFLFQLRPVRNSKWQCYWVSSSVSFIGQRWMVFAFLTRSILSSAQFGKLNIARAEWGITCICIAFLLNSYSVISLTYLWLPNWIK